jgi:uridine phosphorylase
VPSRLRPTAPTAPAAILVGDPGRALLLAQELLEQPKMSNHARGLWGYYGQTPGGAALTIQATGMGGPSAVLVLNDLAELGVRRAIRVGTCAGLDPSCPPGTLFVVGGAIAAGPSAVANDAATSADPGLSEGLLDALAPEAKRRDVLSIDSHPGEAEPHPMAAAADMQTAALLGRARALGIAAAAVLLVSEAEGGSRLLAKDEMEELEKRAGRAASAVLSS